MKKFQILYFIFSYYLNLIKILQIPILLICLCFTSSHLSSTTNSSLILEKYLQTISFGSISSGVRLILFQQQQQLQHQKPQKQKPNNIKLKNNFFKYLLNKKCFFDIYSQDYLSILTNRTTIIMKQKAMERMIKKPIKEINKQTNLITQLVFDFSSQQSWKDLTDEKTLFLSLLSFVDYVYWRCATCRRPPICLLNPANNISSDRLIEWSNLALHNAKRDFRAILAPTLDSNYTVHLNPVYRCRYLHKSIVANSFSEHMNFVIDQAAEQRGCDLEWSPLYVSYNKIEPYCDFHIINGKFVRKFTLEFKLLETFERKLRFRSHLFYANQSWGEKTKELKWTGVIGNVHNRTADIAICDISRTWPRLEAVEFTEHIWVDEMAFISRAAERLSADYWTILNVFSAPIWLAILASILLIFITFCFFVQLGRRINRLSSEHRRSSLSHFCFDYSLTMLHLIAIFVRQSIQTPNLRMSKIRILYGVWMLAIQILTTLYCARYFALLSIAKYGKNIDTVEDLAAAASNEAEPYSIATIKESSFLSAFLSSTPQDGIFYLIGQNINRSSIEQPHADENYFQLIEEENSRFILIGSRLPNKITINREAKDPAAIHIGSGQLQSDFTSIAMPHKSPLTSTFNTIIVCFREMAIFDYWLEKSMAPIRKRIVYKPQYSDNLDVDNQDTDTQQQPLSLNNFRSLFVMWSIGLSISFASFMCEFAKNYWLNFI